MELAEQAQVDIVKSPKVTGDVTVKVTDVPLEEALTNILAAHDYTYIATESMIRVMPLPEIAVLRESLITRIYQITYADADEVAAALAGFVSERGRIALNRGTSHIIITDTESQIKAIDKFIEQIDLMTPQVLVEVRIYDITSSEGFELGAEWHAGLNEPLKTTEHENISSTRSGYDFDQLLPHLGDLFPDTKVTTTVTKPVETTTTIGERITDHDEDRTDTTQTGDVETTTEIDRTDFHEERTDWRFGEERGDDIDYTDTRDEHSWTDPTEERETIVTDDIIQTRDEFGTTTDRPAEDFEVVKTGNVEETEVSGPLGLDFDKYLEEFKDNTWSKSTTTERYITRRRKPFVGASFDRIRGGTLSFSLLNDAVDIELALNILHKEVEAKLIANPRILVLDNQTANFEIIREIPYRELLQVAREDPITYTEFKDVGVHLKVTPHIARDGMIRLHVMPEFGVLVSLNGSGAPTVDTRRADTIAMIKDGQTIAIGGLRKRSTSKNISKVPVLGDMPLIGGLFKSKSESVEVSDLVVFITTTIVTEPMLSALEESQFDATEFPGSEMVKTKREHKLEEPELTQRLNLLLKKLKSP